MTEGNETSYIHVRSRKLSLVVRPSLGEYAKLIEQPDIFSKDCVGNR